ncbi:MAG: ribosome small subunit-dependent GTPase A, partial [Cyanothece sp. SIO1E1]|nr:ribosome small subunit-dependent GTPase A [Cyanothece sp. SIO1E1]
MTTTTGLVSAVSADRFLGTVLSVQANYYWVRLEPKSLLLTAPSDLSAQTQPERISLLCTRRNRLKKIKQKVMVGDWVQVEELDWANRRGAIAEVLERQTELDRPPVANVNQILLVFALSEPLLDPYQLSRFLVKAESTGLPVCLCLNKSDLVTASAREQWSDRLHQWGYHPLFISARTGCNLGNVTTQLQQKITVICGPSGVGKSSLINQLIPTAGLRVSEVSGKLGRGRHTTRHVELFELPNGGIGYEPPVR